MFLKNYTSDVPVSETINKIRKVLIRCGVSAISEEYSVAGEISAITFKIEAATGTMTIRLPADKAKATDALWLDYVGDDAVHTDGNRVAGNGRSGNKKKRRTDFAEQGARTAWKTVQDWIEVQLSMIQMKQADTLQVFLPYVYDGKRTYYEALQSAGFKGLLPPPRDNNNDDNK